MKERQRFPTIMHRKEHMIQECFRRARRQYPRTAAALKVLQEAVDAEIFYSPNAAATASGKRRAREAATGGAASGAAATGAETSRERRWYMQAYRARKERDAMAQTLRVSGGAKAEGGLISEEWLVRVFLSLPTASARSLEQSFADVIGSEVRRVGRTSIGPIRDA